MLGGELYLPGNSPLHKADPRLKVGGLVGLGFLMTSVEVRGLLVLTWGFLLLLWASRIPYKAIGAVFKASILLGCFYTLLLGWVWSDSWHFWTGYWSLAGVIQGLMLGWRILLVFLLTRIFTAVTLPTEQGFGIAYFFTPFNRFSNKAADFALLITLTLRFIPLLIEEAGSLYKARLAKGGLPSSWIRRVKELVSLLLPLLRITLRRAEELAESLMARGYVSGGYRVLEMKEWERVDTWGAALLVLWGIIALVVDGAGIQ